MNIQIKNKKFILIVFILVILLVLISLFEGMLDEIVVKEKEIAMEDIPDTVQKSYGNNYVRVGYWNKVFNIIKNDTKGYELKDTVEETIGKVSTHKKWTISDVTYSKDDYLVISITQDLRDDMMQVYYDRDKFEIVKIIFNSELVYERPTK